MHSMTCSRGLICCPDGVQQYWVKERGPYRFMPAAEMAKAFQASSMGQAAAEELAHPPQRTKQGEPQAAIERCVIWQRVCRLDCGSAMGIPHL